MSNAKYDFIIVGAGTAGCLIANILNTKTNYSICLLEGGQNYDYDKEIMDLTLSGELQTRYGQKYYWPLGDETHELRMRYHCKDYCPNNSKYENHFPYAGGKLFGGSSSINGVQFVKGTVAFFDRIESITGDPLWSAQNAFHSYNQIEKFQGTTTDSQYKGLKGHLPIRQTTPTAMTQKFANAITRVTNQVEVIDYNDPNTPIGGFQTWQLTSFPNGSRGSSSRAYLEPLLRINKNEQNCYLSKNGRLKVFANAQVQSIVFNQNKKAIGVNVTINGQAQKIYCNQKLILSAGIQSPFILLNSGIGPSSDLKKAGIDVVVDNPNVGKNLLNHPIINVFGTANSEDKGLARPDDLYVGGAFLNSETVRDGLRDFQLIGSNPKTGSFSIIGLLLTAESQGYIKIIAPNQFQFNFNYLQNPKDMEKMKELVIMMTEILDDMGNGYKTTLPGKDIVEDDKKLEKYILEGLSQAHHYVGTCKMASVKDCGVVNSNGEVYGVKNLIIADDSILPILNDGNTSATAYLVGYIIAHKILRSF